MKDIDEILGEKIYLKRGKALIVAPSVKHIPTGYRRVFQHTRRIVQTHSKNGYWISTVELLSKHIIGMNHHRFETLVQAPDKTQAIVGRYRTKQYAKRGHRLLEKAFGGKLIRVRGGKLE